MPMVAVPRTRYVTVDGLQVAYQVLGDRPLDLAFVSGTVGHVDMRWENPALARFLEGLASFSRVIVFDRRGVGASDRLAPGAVPSCCTHPRC
jgi:pimeloyl-ACP methyl ester carboxylesterase